MATPFTGGKNAEGPKNAGGKFSKGTGGHTARGVVQPPMGTGASSGGLGSKKTNRVANFGKRLHGSGPGNYKGV